MTITKESLVKQIAEWQDKKQHLVAELNLLQGAIQAHEMLISQLDGKEEAEHVGTDKAINSDI